jgi:DtxR family Mn-dependent transcriptional regulator
VPVTISWISERLQTDERAMRRIHDAAILPGARLIPEARGNVVRVRSADGASAAEIDRGTAALVYVDG